MANDANVVMAEDRERAEQALRVAFAEAVLPPSLPEKVHCLLGLLATAYAETRTARAKRDRAREELTQADQIIRHVSEIMERHGVVPDGPECIESRVERGLVRLEANLTARDVLGRRLVRALEQITKERHYSYAIGATDEHRCAVQIARHALDEVRTAGLGWATDAGEGNRHDE